MPNPASPKRASALLLAAALLVAPDANAFCGFFVARADASLFNTASQVVIVHDEGKTVLTMASDYKGEPRSFALVVPVPVVLDEGMVRVTEAKAVARIDGFTAPRLAEYFDHNPCQQLSRKMRMRSEAPTSARGGGPGRAKPRSLGVTVEAEFTAGEYDIVILSAKESDGLETWLRQNKYNIPRGASSALAPYVRSGMKFFVAKVNLERQAKTGFSSLRPLQFAFPDRRFMLPIRLGMINADGPQDLIAYVITKQHRVEVANYENPKLPTGQEIPTFVKTDFAPFYRAMFAEQVKQKNGRAVFTEYAWNMSWCDPCAADPLSTEELEQLGVWWLDKPANDPRGRRRRPSPGGGAQQAFVTRLHARYTPQTFPEDLMLKVTRDASNFQARYVIRHPWGGGTSCDAVPTYVDALEKRREREAQSLATLTGWSMAKINAQLTPLPEYATKRPPPPPADKDWTDRIKGMFQD